MNRLKTARGVVVGNSRPVICVTECAHQVDPWEFYSRSLKGLGSPNANGWASALCPFHDDHHPSFSVDVGGGGYVCHACGARGGSLIDFVVFRDGCDIFAAARTLNSAWGGVSPPNRNRDTRSPGSRKFRETARHDADARARAALREISIESVPLDLRRHSIVRRYFEARGLGALIDDPPSDLRFHPDLPYWRVVDEKPTLLGRFPALLAVVRGPQGQPVSLHRTYLAPDGRGKAAVPAPRKMCQPLVAGALVGAAIRVYSSEREPLMVGEGLETALAGRVLDPDRAVWCAISACGLGKLVLPRSVRAVRILIDNDNAGRNAADTLAGRLYNEGRRVWMAVPPLDREHADWADLLAPRAGVQ